LKKFVTNLLDRMGALDITIALVVVVGLVRLATRPLTGAETAITEDTFLLACFAIVALITVFRLALGLVQYVLRFGGGIAGVARTVLDEAIRMKVAVVFMALLLVVVPILPFVVAGDEPLRYRVQSFLTYSLAITSVLLSLMTIFLACGTLSNEITDKQIFTVATKPISRGKYLIGKWLGIVMLDAVLLTVAGAAIYGFTALYLAQLPADNRADAMALREEVLVARIASQPEPKVPLEDRVQRKVEELEKTNPEAIIQLGREAAEHYGMTGAQQGRLMQWGRQQAYSQFTDQVLKQWLSVGPQRTEVFIFDGLKPVYEQWQKKLEQWNADVKAAEAAGAQSPPRPEQYIQLRYKIKTSESVPDNQIVMQVAYNGNPTVMKMLTGTAQVVPLPAALVDEEGKLEIAWRNPRSNNPTVSFSGREGMELLYRVGSFGPNFLRTVLSMWAKLAFLAMLGLVAATFLGFPVACLLALLVYAAASMSPYLTESLRSFGNNPADTLGMIEAAMKYIASGVTALVSKYADYQATTKVVDGRLFSWEAAGGCLLWIGVVWTGLVGTLGWLIFRRRELARVQV